MELFRTSAELRAWSRAGGVGGLSGEQPGGVMLVPTMGALHAGHGSLIARARRDADARSAASEPGRGGGGWKVVVTVFVNPSQFAPGEDFARYPRTLEADLDLCALAGADAVLAPSVEDVYPQGLEGGQLTAREMPRVANGPGLEDRARPDHFGGVCQVVRRLFEMTDARAAVFGEKDWQQLQVVRAMTRDLNLGVEIVPSPTVREPDGLAMSSRNRFLSPEERRRGMSLSRALCEACGAGSVAAAEEAMSRELAREGLKADYAVVRDAETLLEVREGRAARALIAARVGPVRLLDNSHWPLM